MQWLLDLLLEYPGHLYLASVYTTLLDYPNGNGFFPSLRCKVCSSDTVEVSFLPSYKFLTPFIFIMNAVGEEQNDLSC